MSRHRALLPVLLALVTLIAGVGLAATFGSQVHEGVVKAERWTVRGVLLGAAIGIGGPIYALLW